MTFRDKGNFSGTEKLFLSRDKGTSGQGNFFRPGTGKHFFPGNPKTLLLATIAWFIFYF